MNEFYKQAAANGLAFLERVTLQGTKEVDAFIGINRLLGDIQSGKLTVVASPDQRTLVLEGVPNQKQQ